MRATDLAVAELAEIERAVDRACGVRLAEQLRHALASAFAGAAEELRLDPASLLARIRACDSRAVAALVERTVVGETYFFRHPEQFEAMRQMLLPPSGASSSLRIWSAGCATGEEPYSIAMTLLAAGRPLAFDRILATDVSERALDACRTGVFGPWSFRQGTSGVAARYLRGERPHLEVTPEVRTLVRFQRHNLLADPAPETSFDMVFCRNVLIYFEQATARQVLEKLAGALRPGGLLLLAPVEVPLAAGLDLELVNQDVALLRRAVAERKTSLAKAPPRAANRRKAVHSVRNPTPTPPRGPVRVEASRPPCPPPSSLPGRFEAAREAARQGEIQRAEHLAANAPPDDPHLPECFVLLSMAAQAKGDLEGAVDALRRALYLEPRLAVAHAHLVPLYHQLGRRSEAEQAKRNALLAIEGLEDGAQLRGVEPMTAGALRQALAAGHLAGAGATRR